MTLSESRYHKRKKRKMRKWVKWTIGIVVFLIVAVVALGGYTLSQVYDAAKESFNGLDRPGEKSELRESAVTIGEDPISILLMGIEDYSSGGENGRADTQIVVTLNPDKNQMTMVSIPRDTRVYVDNVGKWEGYHKINATYTYGAISGYGANKSAVETVEKLLHIPIDKYVAVDFKGFAEIVNALGGVSIDVKHGFWEKNIFNDNKRIYFEEGPTKLNGAEALAFVRMRKRDVNTVYSRMERQRQFIKAAIDEAVSAGTIFKIDEIADVLGKHVETNLKPTEIYALERAYSSMKSGSIRTLNLEAVIGGSGYKVLKEESLSEVTRKLRKSLELPIEAGATSN